MNEPRIIPYACTDSAERPGLQFLAMLHVDRATKERGPTADVVMPFYGETAEAAQLAAETWFRDQREAAVTKRANIEAAAEKRRSAKAGA